MTEDPVSGLKNERLRRLLAALCIHNSAGEDLNVCVCIVCVLCVRVDHVTSLHPNGFAFYFVVVVVRVQEIVPRAAWIKKMKHPHSTRVRPSPLWRGERARVHV